MAEVIPSLEIPYEQLKYLVIECIKGRSSIEFKNFCNSVGSVAIQKQIVHNPNPEGFQTVYYPLQQRDEERVREILWDLVIERVLTLGDYHNPGWPHLSVTAYGKKVLTSQEPVPHDPSGYLSRITREIPNLDAIIIAYLTESIQTYNINQLLSSTITLGCASERALILLIEIYANTFSENEKKKNFQKKIDGKFIKTQFDEFEKCLLPHLKSLPYELAENYAVSLAAVFQMIRYSKNNAGHPTGKAIDKDELFSNLQVFVHYCKYIYQLTAYFEQNPHD